MHVAVEADVQMFGLPDRATIGQALDHFGWGLERQIELVYLTSDVPKEIEWTGYTIIGLMDN